ncbi:hypothetical protein DER46DRAFT_627652 [Fusarium sp. MPI-SDFR-AT-0072]|nr:hypothetical protein DER46DRAFT_627652 [Fusarium sp. MPI-SDFR-AT-0072]
MRFINYITPIISAIGIASADFHLMTKYSNVCNWEKAGRKDVGPVVPYHDITWTIGAVPSNSWNCDAFNDPGHFRATLPQNGENFDWNGYTYSTICGSGPVDFWRNGDKLEVWKHNADPGEKLATCYKQNGDHINCSGWCNEQRVHDAWNRLASVDAFLQTVY